ncbi:MAG: LuxR C-terminal-related transcriptional regulator [Alphaproteobacteria bacterium]|nr:LuxR C-terminal-related transcriptional regulator [Alphaproteobacteria bacterium]
MAGRGANTDLITSARELAALTSLKEGAAVLSAAGRRIGLPLCAVVDDYSSNTLLTDEEGITLAERFGWPVEAIEGWVDQGLTLFSPLGAACRLARRPFVWHQADFALALPEPSRKVEGRQERVLDFLGELGIKGGIAAPVHRPLGRIGSVVWMCFEDSLDLEALLKAHEDGFFLLGHYFLDLVSRAQDEGPVIEGAVTLTEREVECLTWVALGKTDAEIGKIISRSPTTARFHIDKATRKLNAGSRAQAVAKAAQLGIIGPVLAPFPERGPAKG